MLGTKEGILAFAASSLALLTVSSAFSDVWSQEQSYTFTVVFDAGRTSLKFLGRASINSSGTVAFVHSASGRRITVADGERSSVIKESTPDLFVGGNSAVINDRGAVAFYVQAQNCPVPFGACGGLVVSDGRDEILVIDPLDLNRMFRGVVDPTINNSGAVAFCRSAGNDPNPGTYVLKKDNSTRHGLGWCSQAGGTNVISDSGRLASVETPPSGGSALHAVYLFGKNGEEQHPFAVARDGSFPLIHSADINNGGDAAFCVNHGPASLGIVYKADKNGTVEQVVTGTSCGSVSINDAGEIAFFNEAGGISVSKQNRIKTVLSRGDALLGKTVQFLQFSETGSGMNNAGQIAINVQFTDGTAAVVRAEPD